MSGTRCFRELKELRPSPDEETLRAGEPPLVIALPGSRVSEIRRLGPKRTLGLVAARHGAIEIVLPTVPHLLEEVSELAATWPIRPRIVTDGADRI